MAPFQSNRGRGRGRGGRGSSSYVGSSRGRGSRFRDNNNNGRNFSFRSRGGGRGGGNHNPGATLRPIQFTQKDLTPFRKEFLACTEQLPPQQVFAWRTQHEISTRGTNVPNPMLTFAQSGLDRTILLQFQRLGFPAPTPIQSQSWPALLSGRDMIGVAQTGSGKTFAFLIPGIVHLQGQQFTGQQYNNGPVVVVVAPTRELACQIEEECKKICQQLGIQVACCYGGAPRRQQEWQLRRGVDILVCTPGRMLDFLEKGVVNFKRTSYVVLDEADRMLDMGFEKPIRTIMGQIRPDRQVALFSATWPREVQNLAREFTPNNSVFIKVGSAENQASDTITQTIIPITHNGEKENHLQKILSANRTEKILIFTATKRMADRLSRQLNQQGYQTDAMHGDKEQRQRDYTLRNFKSGRCNILVATDVAARGIHVNDIKFVVNYDFPNNCEDYVHRIGRTGRAGNTGTAISFFSVKDDARKAGKLIKILKKSNQVIPGILTSMGGRYGGRGGGRRNYGNNRFGGGRGRGGRRFGGRGRSSYGRY